MIHSVLGADAKKVLKVLSRQDFLRSFYLAGGTGCALHIGHRLSSTSGTGSPKISISSRKMNSRFSPSGILSGIWADS